MDDVWDHAFVGGGIAASVLALRLARDGAGPMLVIDPTPADPRTFAYWADRPLALDDLVEHDWTKLRIADASGSFDRELGAYRYRLIRAARLHAAARDAVERAGGRVVCARVDAVEDGPEAAALVVAGDRYRARWVYDSRPPSGPLPGLVQGIAGAWVETDEDAFEPDVATLMDFRAPQEDGAVRFFHVLPTTRRRALVTGVTFAVDRRPIDVEAYLSQVLGLRGWRITGREGGVTPMTDHGFQRRSGSRVLTIGQAGGRLKASTGYALVRIEDDARQIAASLRSSGHPFDLPVDSEVGRWLDATLLELIAARGPATVPVFVAMFRDNPLERVLRFLDEVSSPVDLARLVWTLPGWSAFLGAALRVLGARFAAAWRFWAFAVGVIGAPALAFLALAPTDVEAAGPAMLVFLLGPMLLGSLLGWGLPGAPARRVIPAVGLALAVTVAIIAVSTAFAFAGGALVVGGSPDAAKALTGAATGAVTSTLEELGWAAGGLAIARAGLGPRLGVLGLGLVWAAWHLVIAVFAPPEIAAGMFGTSAPLGVARVASFAVGCVAYRALLTSLRDRADAVWPAVAAHAIGNVLLGAMIGSGWARLDPDGPWALFPGPTGLPFLAAAVAAAVWLGRRPGR